MIKQEWLDQAKEFQKKADAAYERGDETLGIYYETKADACWANAADAPDKERA